MPVKLWTEKYFPANYEEFVGNPEIVDYARAWAKRWNSGHKEKPLLLYGQTGAGKTCLAYLVAKQNDWGVFELNASDFRNKDIIERLVGAASQNASFSGKPRLILIDEVDGIRGSADRGGLAAIARILRETQNPIILTANDIYSNQNLATVRRYCKLLEFKKINYLSIAKYAREILEKESVEFEEDGIKELAKNSSGDLRSVLLDLQTLASDEKITQKSIESLGYRERQEKIFKVLMDIFKGKDFFEIRRARNSLDMSNDLLERWIEENIPRQYTKPEDIAAAFERLSRANIFEGRIIRRQHWGFLRYSSELMTAGVALSRKHDYHGYVPYQFPTLLSKLSKSKGLRAMKKELARKIGKQTHSSFRQILSYDLPYLKMLVQNSDYAVGLTAAFGFDGNELAFLLDTKPERKKVQKILEQAEELRKQNIATKRRRVSPLMQTEAKGKHGQEAAQELELGNTQTKLF